MLNNMSIDHILVIIMIIYVIYVIIKKKDIIQEHFEGLPMSNLFPDVPSTVSHLFDPDNIPPVEPPLIKSNKECSDVSLNEAVFGYTLSKLNQIKTPN